MSTYATPVPGASSYAQASALAQKAYSNAMSRYQQQRGNTLLKYGYKQNPDGSYGVDANNEYGQYQQMLRGEASNTEHLARAQAASGWGDSSGYLGAERENLDYGKGQEQAALGTALTGDLADINSGEQDAAYQRDAALYQGQLDETRTNVAAGNYDPGNYNGIGEPVDKAPAATPLRKATPATHAAGKQQLLKAAVKKGKKAKKGGR